MRVVIIGAGRVGGFLARELSEAGHAVLMVEPKPDRAREAAETSGALVVEGDGTDLQLLGELEIRSSDYVVALTSADEDNLVACQLARAAFGVRRLLARLNDPRNRATFEALDIPVVSVTDLLVQVISHELDLSELVRVAIIGRGEISLFEVELPDDVADRSVAEIALPADTVLVSIHRDDTVHVPAGSTVVSAGDRVLVVSRVELEDEVRDALCLPDRG